MGTKYKDVGGGPATGLANDFVSFLQNGLSTGSFGAGTAGSRFQGANPVGSTMGIAGVLNDLLSGGAGVLGGSLSDMISKDTERQAQALRARFGVGGGTSFGTPAAYAESLLRSEQAPKLTQAVGGLQMQALGQLLPIFAGLAGKGISQRETIASPSPWASAASIAAPIVGAGLGAAFGQPGIGASIGSSIGGAFGGAGGPVGAGSVSAAAPFIMGGGGLFGAGGGSPLGLSPSIGMIDPFSFNPSIFQGARFGY